MARDTRERDSRALELYTSGNNVRQVAEALEISYGTAYAAIKKMGGSRVFRNRGARAKIE